MIGVDDLFKSDFIYICIYIYIYYILLDFINRPMLSHILYDIKIPSIMIRFKTFIHRRITSSDVVFVRILFLTIEIFKPSDILSNSKFKQRLKYKLHADLGR